ncbi:Zinc finger, CCHC-type [Cinara cedri]|uniref:Zinc finger, CCHC-type n=1 Tax=Cinara cedri TaxID=506608 RepID=A0A5E4MAV0_9HEMI|nr:Zinc finger, CCHC-type [Cinara cedri]
MVSCRVKVVADRVWCFKCLAFGHMGRDCKRPDRSGCCWMCGEVGYKAAACTATNEARMAFTRALDGHVETDRVERPMEGDETSG